MLTLKIWWTILSSWEKNLGWAGKPHSTVIIVQVTVQAWEINAIGKRDYIKEKISRPRAELWVMAIFWNIKIKRKRCTRKRLTNFGRLRRKFGGEGKKNDQLCEWNKDSTENWPLVLAVTSSAAFAREMSVDDARLEQVEEWKDRESEDHECRWLWKLDEKGGKEI